MRAQGQCDDNAHLERLSLADFFRNYTIRKYVRNAADEIVAAEISRCRRPAILRVFPLTNLNEEAGMNAPGNELYFRTQTLLHVPFDRVSKHELRQAGESWHQAFMRHLAAADQQRLPSTEWLDGRTRQDWLPLAGHI